jgi:hypothetical protein
MDNFSSYIEKVCNVISDDNKKGNINPFINYLAWACWLGDPNKILDLFNNNASKQLAIEHYQERWEKFFDKTNSIIEGYEGNLPYFKEMELKFAQPETTETR